jgi:hypothetical protein
MSTELLAELVGGTTIGVVIALFLMLWKARTSPRGAVIAALGGIVLAGWAIVTSVLAAKGFYRPPDIRSLPPVGIQLGLALAAMLGCFSVSPTLRGLLSNQKFLLRLNVWRLLGLLFLGLMLTRQMPALWAIPAGTGDVLVGATAFWVASRVESPGGRRLAILFNWFGLLDLVVAVGLGVTANPGPAQIFHPAVSGELITEFPLALVPGFLVPLAFMVHIASLSGLRR